MIAGGRVRVAVAGGRVIAVGRVTPERARLACDSSLVEVRHGRGAGRAGRAGREGAGGAAGSDRNASPHRAPILDVGRRTRTVPTALRRALESRDRGCRFPGCGLRLTDAHHIEHWADGGATKLDNLVLLCARHHRRVHEGGFRVFCDRTGRVVFFTPKGKALFDAPGGDARPDRGRLPERRTERSEQRTEWNPERSFEGNPEQNLEGNPEQRLVSSLVRRNRELGVAPDWRSGAPTCKNDRDIPWTIEAAALEALDP